MPHKNRQRHNYGPGYVDPSKQRVDINISTGRPSHRGDVPIDESKQRRINSALKRYQALKAEDGLIDFTAQGPSDFYKVGRDDISQIVATRAPKLSQKQKDAYGRTAVRLGQDPTEFIRQRGEGRIVDEGKGVLPNGKPNRSLRADVIVDDMLKKWEAGQRKLRIDEAAGGTEAEVAKALRTVSQVNPEILNGLSVYLAGSPKAKAKSWNPLLRKMLKDNKIPVFVQMYGGRTGGTPVRNKDGKVVGAKANRWDDKTWGQAFDKFNSFRDAGIDARPLMSLSDKHIGHGPASIREARRRAERIFESTGYIPSVWHATSVRAPAPEGMGAAVDQWIRKMRRKG